MDLEDIKKVHCVGIGGIGISALARFFVARHVVVSGSDAQESDETHDLRTRGVTVTIGHAAVNVPEGVDVLIYSSAVDAENPELVTARERNIQAYTYTQALGQLMTHFTSVAVSGTNGKTSTTAMLGTLLVAAGNDPTVILGGKVGEWDRNLHLGTSDLFVVEGCEYKRNMLDLNPHVIVLTNIEEDHLDYYKDIEDIKDAFTEYVRKLGSDDLLVCNMDDENVREVVSHATARLITFGIDTEASIQASNIRYEGNLQKFDVTAFGESIGTFSLSAPGLFNVYNALGAIATALDLGVPVEHIQNGLTKFQGTWRRFEILPFVKGKVLVNDYAHHPTAVRRTLQAARQLYGDKRILAVFQPHQKDRTLKLFDAFTESFADADEVVLVEIYQVKGREDGALSISSRDLARAVENTGGVDRVIYKESTAETEKYIAQHRDDFDVVVIMGAGDVDAVARSLSKEARVEYD